MGKWRGHRTVMSVGEQLEVLWHHWSTHLNASVAVVKLNTLKFEIDWYHIVSCM